MVRDIPILVKVSWVRFSVLVHRIGLMILLVSFRLTIVRSLLPIYIRLIHISVKLTFGKMFLICCTMIMYVSASIVVTLFMLMISMLLRFLVMVIPTMSILWVQIPKRSF